MADLATMLARLLGQQEEEINLSSAAPNPQANTRGIFGRRPTGVPATGYADIAPMPPAWAAEVRPHQREIVPEAEPINPFPFPMGIPEPPRVQRAPMPTAARISVPNQASPGAYGNFADYANAQLGLRPPPMQVDREPWRQSRQVAETPLYRPLAVGEAAPARGLEPPSAPSRREPAPFSMEDEAWQTAVARAKESIREDRRAAGRRIPRPGNPLIAQAWSDPDRRTRRGGR